MIRKAYQSVEQIWCPLRGILGMCVVVYIIFYTYSMSHRK